MTYTDNSNTPTSSIVFPTWVRNTRCVTHTHRHVSEQLHGLAISEITYRRSTAAPRNHRCVKNIMPIWWKVIR